MHPPRIFLATVALLLVATGGAAQPLAQPLDLPGLLEVSRGIASRSIARAIPVEDVADAASLLVTDLLRARHENPALVDRVADSVRLEVLASAPASADLVVGTLRLSRPVARGAVGARIGRERLAVIGRLRGALPDQTASLTDDDLLALLPELVHAAEPAIIPADILAPIVVALSPEAPQ